MCVCNNISHAILAPNAEEFRARRVAISKKDVMPNCLFIATINKSPFELQRKQIPFITAPTWSSSQKTSRSTSQRSVKMSDSQLYEETYSITSINSAKYDRVSRIYGSSPSNDTAMSLDVNTELYPVSVGETIQLVLATTLALDGSKEGESGGQAWRNVGKGGEATLADAFDYVCRGRIYRFEEGAEGML